MTKQIKRSALLIGGIATVTIFSALTFSANSYAAGYAVAEQSVTGLGRAFAGGAAIAEDASTVFYNPAGLTQLTNSQINQAINAIFPRADFDDEGSAVPNFGGAGGFSGQALTGGGDTTDSIGIVPNLYLAHRLSDRAVVGLGVNAPFGLVTEYDSDWVGRYHAIKSDLLTVNINPSIGFKVNDKWSIGAGFNAQYIDLELTQAADLGARAGFPQAADGKVKLTADDWSYGYNLGATFQATEYTRWGLSYRSKISHHLTGDGKLTSAAGALVTKEKISGDVSVPESLSLAMHHQASDKLAIIADATWVRWSRFEELKIESAGILNSTKPEEWENSMRYGLGAIYQHSPKWTFRVGYAYEETPVPNPEHRTARIPDNTRNWIAVGASYQMSKHLILDAGYSHVFVKNPDINETDHNGYTLKGKYDADTDILGIQMRWEFL